MSTLYEITGQYLALYEMLESADELEMKVITDTLEGMDGELEEKADAYAKIMTELDAEAAKFEKEADRLAERAGQLHSRSKLLKDRLRSAMILCNRKKIKTDLYSFAICKNGGAAPFYAGNGRTDRRRSRSYHLSARQCVGIYRPGMPCSVRT